MSPEEAQPGGEASGAEQRVGLAPGTLLYLGPGAAHRPVVREALYGPGGATLRQLGVDEEPGPRPEGVWRWIHVTGVHDLDLLGSLGRSFELHPLVLEDIASTQQRPKLDQFEEYLFVAVRWLEWGERQFGDEQVSLVVGNGWVLSFQEREENLFRAVEERLVAGKGNIRRLGPGYLAYALLDTLADHYMLLAERLEAELERLEEQFNRDPRLDPLESIQGLKRRAVGLRRAAFPLRGIASRLERAGEAFFPREGAAFLRELQDHCAHILESSEHLGEAVGWLQQLYLGVVNTRLNRVIHVLTIIASIFIPLTFIVGLYGMNFENMPELGWKYGYPACLTFMAVLAVGMYLYYRRRTWI